MLPLPITHHPPPPLLKRFANPCIFLKNSMAEQTSCPLRNLHHLESCSGSLLMESLGVRICSTVRIPHCLRRIRLLVGRVCRYQVFPSHTRPFLTFRPSPFPPLMFAEDFFLSLSRLCSASLRIHLAAASNFQGGGGESPLYMVVI